MEYSYNNFIEDLKLGSEIELSYMNSSYFIFYDDRGSILINVDDNTKLIFKSDEEFLSSPIFV